MRELPILFDDLRVTIGFRMKPPPETTRLPLQTLSASDRRELLRLARDLNNVSEACRRYRCSRDTYYRLLRRYSAQGDTAFEDPPRSKIHSNSLSAEIEKIVITYSANRPSYGRERIAHNLQKQGIQISPGAVRKVWMRHGLPTNRRSPSRESTIVPLIFEQQLPTLLLRSSRQIEVSVPNYQSIQYEILIDSRSLFVHFRRMAPASATTPVETSGTWIDSVRLFYRRIYQSDPLIESSTTGSTEHFSATARFWKTFEREHWQVTKTVGPMLPIEHRLAQLEGWLYFYNYERISKTIRGVAYSPWEILISHCRAQENDFE